jgi:hypothetical protein
MLQRLPAHFYWVADPWPAVPINCTMTLHAIIAAAACTHIKRARTPWLEATGAVHYYRRYNHNETSIMQCNKKASLSAAHLPHTAPQCINPAPSTQHSSLPTPSTAAGCPHHWLMPAGTGRQAY